MTDLRKSLTDRLIAIGVEPEEATRLFLAAKDAQDAIHDYRIRALQALVAAFPDNKAMLLVTGLVLEIEVEDTLHLCNAFKEVVT